MHHFQPEKENIMSFLEALTVNNNRVWFKESKEEYDEAMEDFLKIILDLSEEVRGIDPSIKEDFIKNYIFRIYRDVRFSKDKRPYKNHFGAHIANGGRKSEQGGYYIHIEPEGIMIAGGVYAPQKEVLKAIRNEIYYNLSDFKSIVESSDFKNQFGELSGSKLKNGPKNFPKEHEALEFLKHKDYIAVRKFTNEEFFNENFFEEVIKVCKAIKPLNKFLNHAISMKEDQ